MNNRVIAVEMQYDPHRQLMTLRATLPSGNTYVIRDIEADSLAEAQRMAADFKFMYEQLGFEVWK